MFNTQILAGSSGQGGETQQSLKFNDDESQYLSWTPAAAGNRKTFTYSTWVKRGKISADNPHWGISAGTLNNTSNPRTEMLFNPSDSIVIGFNTGSWFESTTNAKFRDTSAWYHFVVSVDMTQSTASDRMKFYVNGVLQTFSTYSVPAQNTDLPINNTLLHGIGEYIAGESSASYQFDGYLSDVYFIDGQALDPTSFGQFTNGYWEAIDYAGTYGTNGFHLTFQDDVVSEGFNATTYLATEANQSISGIGFSPDLVIVKNRDSSSNARWGVIDSVRGVNKTLATDITDAEVTIRSDLLTSFDADGFSLGADAAAYGWNNQTYTAGDRQVAWCWDAGSGSPVSNTDGSITSTVKANPSYGFSIVSYVGNGSSSQTVGHGLGAVSDPSLLIVKNRDQTDNWIVRINLSGTNKFLFLDDTSSGGTSSVTLPTTDVFGVGTSGYDNTSGENYIAYLFSSVAGYSSIGSFTGTGAAGNAITTGFRPAFVMVKRSNNTGNWIIWDTTRTPQSGTIQGSYISANSSDGEESPSGSNDIEFTDTGFTLQDNGIYSNSSGDTFIYMAFADTREAAFWKDVSGQGNHWTPNNLDYRDSLIDSPANNFAVMNPVIGPHGCTVQEGNLYVTVPDNKSIGSTFAVDSGKWYVEFYADSSSFVSAGIVGDSQAFGANLNSSSVAYMYSYVGTVYKQGTGDTTPTSFTSGDVIGFYIDLDNNKLYIYKNGAGITTSEGTHSVGSLGISITNRNYYFGTTSNGNNAQVIFNFGQDSTFSGARPAGGNQDDNGIGDFAYPVPSGGYLALCTANLPTPTIVDGSTAFSTVLYSGTGATQSITGVGFAPDLVWIKNRSSANSHQLVDSVRGATKHVFSNTTDQEYTYANGLTSFNTDGFSIGNLNDVNNASYNYVGWNWKAGGTAVSNTDGSITSQVSANVDAGFSVLTYSPSGSSGSVGHGLGVTPSVVIVKRRDTTGQWVSHWTAISGANKQLYLNGTNAVDTNNISSLTSTTFTVSGWSEVATAGGSYVAYCFADVDGFSKAGSYTGNGSNDGPFVYTGFRPAFVIMKRTDSTSDWVTIDDARSTYNAVDDVLIPNKSDAEAANLGSGYEVDFTSNGFKVRSTWSAQNASGGTYIYLAFAETPFKLANAR